MIFISFAQKVYILFASIEISRQEYPLFCGKTTCFDMKVGEKHVSLFKKGAIFPRNFTKDSHISHDNRLYDNASVSNKMRKNIRS